MSRKKSRKRAAAVAREALEAAHKHFLETLKAARQWAKENPRPQIPSCIVRYPVRRAIKKPKTKEEYERMKLERVGYDPGLGRFFETQWEAEEYRRRKGLVQMSAREFDTEVGDAPSPVSEPYYSYLDKIPGIGPIPENVPKPEIRIERQQPILNDDQQD